MDGAELLTELSLSKIVDCNNWRGLALFCPRRIEGLGVLRGGQGELAKDCRIEMGLGSVLFRSWVRKAMSSEGDSHRIFGLCLYIGHIQAFLVTRMMMSTMYDESMSELRTFITFDTPDPSG
jgi:hypothetical protein